MAKSASQRASESRNRRIVRENAARRDSRLFAEIIVDRMADEDVITVSPSLRDNSIDFDWGPNTAAGRAAYADMESFCQEHGRTFAEVMGEIELIILDRLLPRLGKKLAGPGHWTPSAEEKAQFRATLGAK